MYASMWVGGEPKQSRNSGCRRSTRRGYIETTRITVHQCSKTTPPPLSLQNSVQSQHKQKETQTSTMPCTPPPPTHSGRPKAAKSAVAEEGGKRAGDEEEEVSPSLLPGWEGRKAHCLVLEVLLRPGVLRVAHVGQVAKMGLHGAEEPRLHLVRDAVLRASLHHDGCDLRVVRLVDCGEEVVDDLVVQRAAQVGPDAVAVRVVLRRHNLHHGPVTGPVVLLLLVEEDKLVRNVGNLEVEGQPGPGEQLRGQEGQQKVQRGQRGEHCGQPHPEQQEAELPRDKGVEPERRGVDPDRPVVQLGVDTEVPNAVLDGQEGVQQPRVQVLQAVVGEKLLPPRDPSQLALVGVLVPDVGVHPANVGEDVVTNGVLLQPRVEARTRDDVPGDSNPPPHPRLVGQGAVAGVMHDLQPEEGLAQAVDRREEPPPGPQVHQVGQGEPPNAAPVDHRGA
eukprot:RCo042880